MCAWKKAISPQHTGTNFSSLRSASLASLHSSSRQLRCLHSKTGNAFISSCTSWENIGSTVNFFNCPDTNSTNLPVPMPSFEPSSFLLQWCSKPKLISSTVHRDIVQTVPSHPPPHHPQSADSFPPASRCTDAFNLPVFNNKEAGLLSSSFQTDLEWHNSSPPYISTLFNPYATLTILQKILRSLMSLILLVLLATLKPPF